MLKDNLADRFQSVDKTPEPSHQPDPTKGLFRGLIVGTLGPLITIPIDKLQANIVVKPDIKFNGISSLWKNPAILSLLKNPLKGYPFIASANIPRSTVTFMSGPVITKQLQTTSIDQHTSELIGYTFAGALEGLISGPLTVIRQKLFTTSMPSARHVISNLSWKELASKSLLSTSYLTLRNATFWPTYNSAVQQIEAHVSYKKDNAYYQNQMKQFLVGAGAGAIATLPSQPFDSLMKRRLYDPSLSAWQLISETAKKSPWQVISKLFYRGYSISLVRLPISMGATNIGVHLADSIYNNYQSNSLKNSESARLSSQNIWSSKPIDCSNNPTQDVKTTPTINKP